MAHVDNRGERHQTKGLMSWTIALHVRFWVIVFPMQDNTVKWPNVAKFEERERQQQNFRNSFWRWTFSLHDILPNVVPKPFVCHSCFNNNTTNNTGFISWQCIPGGLLLVISMVVYHLPKHSGNFGWDVNGKTVLVRPNGKFPKYSGRLER